MGPKNLVAKDPIAENLAITENQGIRDDLKKLAVEGKRMVR